MGIQKNRLCQFFVALLLLVIPAVVSAEAPIEKEQKIYRVVTSQDSGEQLIEVDSPRPGALFEYELTYRNVSGKHLDGIVVRQPVYAGASYILESATAPEGTELHISIDNGATFHPEDTFNQGLATSNAVGLRSGKSFQALQWVFRRSMRADEILKVRYRVRVE